MGLFQYSVQVLEAVHRQIERYVNRELRHNEGRVREEANRAIGKAISSHEFRIPLLGYLGLLSDRTPRERPPERS